jgi:hypothetical protein
MVARMRAGPEPFDFWSGLLLFWTLFQPPGPIDQPDTCEPAV